MNTCEKCIYSKMCAKKLQFSSLNPTKNVYYDRPELNPLNNNDCPDFKDSNRFVELPQDVKPDISVTEIYENGAYIAKKKVHIDYEMNYINMDKSRHNSVFAELLKEKLELESI